MARAGNIDPVRQLDHQSPALRDAQLGTFLEEFRTKWNGFMAAVDAANVTGLGTANVANFSLGPIGTRTAK